MPPQHVLNSANSTVIDYSANLNYKSILILTTHAHCSLRYALARRARIKYAFGATRRDATLLDSTGDWRLHRERDWEALRSARKTHNKYGSTALCDVRSGLDL